MVAVILIPVIVVFLCLNGYLADHASDIAEQKGGVKRFWFHMCFWLGPVAYILVAAMPDRNAVAKMDETIALLKETNQLLRDLLVSNGMPGDAEKKE